MNNAWVASRCVVKQHAKWPHSWCVSITLWLSMTSLLIGTLWYSSILSLTDLIALVSALQFSIEISSIATELAFIFWTGVSTKATFWQLSPPVRPVIALCSACEQALVFGFCLMTQLPFATSATTHGKIYWKPCLKVWNGKDHVKNSPCKQILNSNTTLFVFA